MATNREKLPYGISEYIRNHFREDFLFDVKDVKKVGDRMYYTIEVSQDNYIHTLKFDEKGQLVREDADEAFPPDTHDAPGYGDIPE